MYKSEVKSTQRRVTRIKFNDLIDRPIDITSREERFAIRDAMAAEDARMDRLKARKQKNEDLMKACIERKQKLNQRLKSLSANPNRPGQIQEAFMNAARTTLTREQWNEVMDRAHEIIGAMQSQQYNGVEVFVKRKKLANVVIQGPPAGGPAGMES